MTEIRLRPMYRWLLGLGLAGALILMLPIRVAEPESKAPKTIRSNDAAQVVVPASAAQLVGDPLGGNDLESNANRGRSADNLHAALLNDFNNLTNGRAFAEKHWQNRDHGGSLYVRTLLKQCELAADSGDVLKKGDIDFSKLPQEEFVAASKALASLQARCSQFTTDDYQKYIVAKASAPGDSHDPYNTLLRDFLKAARLDQDAKRGAVASLVERPDPLIFEEIGARLSMTKLSGEGVIFFDGINYPIRDNPEILSAYKLVPCGLGLRCDDSDFEVVLSCATGRGCFASRFEMIKRNDLGNDPIRYQKVIGLYSQMIEAINKKNIGAFVTEPHN